MTTYGPEKLKQAADELLGSFEPTPAARQRILSACRTAGVSQMQSKKVRRMTASRWAAGLAAGFLVCALTAIGIGLGLGGSIRNVSGAPAQAAQTDTQPQAVFASKTPSGGIELIQTGSAESAGDEQMQFLLNDRQVSIRITQGDNGLYGIADENGAWLIEPEYEAITVDESGRIETSIHGTVQFLSFEDLFAAAP